MAERSYQELAEDFALLAREYMDLEKAHGALLEEHKNLLARFHRMKAENASLRTCRNQATASRDKYRKQLLRQEAAHR